MVEWKHDMLSVAAREFNMPGYRVVSVLLVGLLLIGAPFFFFGGPGYHSSRSFQAGWDMGHILYFALLSCLLNLFLARRYRFLSPWFRLGLVFTSALALGLTVELLQTTQANRSPSGLDVLRNQLGCLLAFAFLPPQANRKARGQRLLRLMALLLLLLAAWPLTQAGIDEYLAVRQFPVLADFETPFERSRWVNARQLRLETDLVRHGKRAVRVRLSTAKYSGVSLFHFPGDWRGYEWLRFSVYNPQAEPLELHCRVHDATHKDQGQAFHDRFNQQLSLHPGWNDVALSLQKVKNAPRGRVMDLQHIEGLGLFVIQQKMPLDIFLDHVHLSR